MKKYFDEVTQWFNGKEREVVANCLVCGEKMLSDVSHVSHIKYTCDTISCNKCGFEWEWYQPTQETLDEFYNKSKAMDMWADIKKEEKERQENKFFPLWSWIQAEGIRSILDVGCGNGVFLNHFDIGVDRVGIETNEAAVKHCNFPVYKDYKTFGESLHSKKKYELITMFGVLEHLKQPLEEVKKYSEFLASDGYFGIIVPNVDSLVVKVLGSECCTFCPQHLWYFNIESLVKLMKKADFNPSFHFTIEAETQPILRKLKGLNPYEDIGITLTDWDITQKSILNAGRGYKIVALFHKEKVNG